MYSKRSVIKNSLLMMYEDIPEMVDFIDGTDFTEIDKKYYDTFYSKMSAEDEKEVEKFLDSGLMEKYEAAIAEATEACIEDVQNTLAVFLNKQNKKHLH